VEIHWTPSHEGILGNDEANEADEGKGTPKVKAKDTLPSRNHPRRQMYEFTQKRWAQLWEDTRRGRQLLEIVKRPTLKVLGKYNGLSRPLCSFAI
ncbi:hypothetical protein V2W45_1228402, partial [Cenococcum geophilum]